MDNKRMIIICLVGQMIIVLFVLCYFLFLPWLKGEDMNEAIPYLMVYIVLDMLIKHFYKKDKEE
jgi:hypothetical protein